MFRQILASQWRWSALAVVLLAIAAFGIPVWVVQRAGLIHPTEWDVVQMLAQIREIGVLFPLLALIAGATMAGTAWAADQRGQHVYALSLPVPRWYYALLRFAAGLLLLIPIALCVWIGAIVAVKAASIPEGLTSYVAPMTLRFILSMLVTYALLFAVVAAPKRVQQIVLAAFVLLIGLQVIAVLAGIKADILGNTIGRLFEWPGPFQVIAGPWMLIDL
jgi:hypothetical protein